MKDRFMTPSDVLWMKRRRSSGFATDKGVCLPPNDQIFSAISRGMLNQTPEASLRSLDDLLGIDDQREKDGFPKKIKIGRVLAGPSKIIMVPYVEEEKLIHGEFEAKIEDEDNEDIGENAGHGEGEVGDVIGESPIPGEG